MNYFIIVKGREIDVGTTQPVYDAKKKGWVTDKGIFTTASPSDYGVLAKDQIATVTPTHQAELNKAARAS